MIAFASRSSNCDRLFHSKSHWVLCAIRRDNIIVEENLASNRKSKAKTEQSKACACTGRVRCVAAHFIWVCGLLNMCALTPNLLKEQSSHHQCTHELNVLYLCCALTNEPWTTTYVWRARRSMRLSTAYNTTPSVISRLQIGKHRVQLRWATGL